MKTTITFKTLGYILMSVCAAMFISSCAKQSGYYLNTTTVVKSGNVQFFIATDTTHVLATPTDTVSFTSYSVPQTTVTATNGQKNTKLTLKFNANTKGTFNINTISVTIPQKSGGVLTTSSTNIGTVTVDSINANKGYLSGNFTSKLILSAADTAVVTGLFSIQQ